MKTNHEKISESINSTEVMVILTPESDSEKDILNRSSANQIDVTDSMLSDHIVFYLAKHFPGMSVLKGDFLEEPGKFLVQLQRTK